MLTQHSVLNVYIRYRIYESMDLGHQWLNDFNETYFLWVQLDEMIRTSFRNCADDMLPA